MHIVWCAGKLHFVASVYDGWLRNRGQYSHRASYYLTSSLKRKCSQYIYTTKFNIYNSWSRKTMNNDAGVEWANAVITSLYTCPLLSCCLMLKCCRNTIQTFGSIL